MFHRKFVCHIVAWFVFMAASVACGGVVVVRDEATVRAAWKEGDRNDWPGAVLKPKVTDWRGYDRLVFDVTNLEDGGETISLYIQSPDTPKNSGKHCYLRAPAWATVRWEVPLNYFEDGKADQGNVSRIHLYTHRPRGVNITFSGFTLLKPGEMPPPVRTPTSLAAALKTGRKDYQRRQARRRADFVAALRSANVRDGVQNDKIVYGVGTAMDQVRPKETYSLKSASGIRVRLARNEWEGRQIFVTPVKESLRGVRIKVSPLKMKNDVRGKFVANGVQFPMKDIKVSPIGYVKTTSAPRYGIGRNVSTNVAPGYVRQTIKAELGWWPDLILDFLDSVDIAEGDVQGFWVSVHASEEQVPGTYEGTVLITAENAKPIALPMTVRVNNFTLPRKPVIPTLVSFSPGAYVAPDHKQEHADLSRRFKEDPESPVNLWQRHRLAWGDFLADHFITMAPMYHHGTSSLPYDVWTRLKAQGRMGCYNLCYFSSQSIPKTTEEEKRWNTWFDWVSSVIARNYAKAKELGLEKEALVYCFDEATTNRFPEIDRIMAKMKSLYPDIPFLTTSYDDAYGTGSSLRDMDWFCPQIPKFNSVQAEKSRNSGHKVWWYFACEQRAPCANIYTEGPPIEIRLIMGAMSARYRPDGFLYYQCSYFNNGSCVTKGPYTDWNPRSWWNQHGDATWVGVGPGGVPLSTIRLENFRDGLEDLAYVRLVEAKLGRHVDVPESVVSSISNFTDDPCEVERWRDRLADYIEQ